MQLSQNALLDKNMRSLVDKRSIITVLYILVWLDSHTVYIILQQPSKLQAIIYGPLAQLAEHLTFNQGVPRSSRGWLTKESFTSVKGSFLCLRGLSCSQPACRPNGFKTGYLDYSINPAWP